MVECTKSKAVAPMAQLYFWQEVRMMGRHGVMLGNDKGYAKWGATGCFLQLFGDLCKSLLFN